MLWRQGVLGIRRVHGCDSHRALGTSLGLQERARGRVQVRKERGQLVLPKLVCCPCCPLMLLA